MAMQAPAQGLDAVVGRNVHMLMWDRRLTQLELGARIGMDQSSLGKRLRGERGWTLDQLRNVAAALETTIAYLVGEVGDQSVHPLGLEPRTHWFRDKAPATISSLDAKRHERASRREPIELPKVVTA